VALHKQVDVADQDGELAINPTYVQERGLQVPTYRMPEMGMLPRTALQVVRDELILDGNARLNLATFVTTYMEDEATELMAESFDKNMIDKDEYPQTAEIERRCVNILAHLWHSPAGGEAAGCSTTGSSEACMLGGMALLWRWRKVRRAAGQDATKPNLVMGSNVQVCWDKFCRYWEVEPRQVPMEKGQLHLTADQAAAACDENTIGVVAILGSTMDGSYEPVKEISEALDQLQQAKGFDVPIHVDGASGGFVAPFIQPFLEWDFKLARVASINASGHKYGLVYPGVGWVVWRDQAALPEELIFKVNYLGGQMPTFALNFSRPGSNVIAQYYNFLRLGFNGYREVQQACQDVAVYLSSEIAKIGPFELLTEGKELPVFAFKLRDDVTSYSVFDISERLRARGWLVPAYTFPANLQETAVIRIVVKNGFSQDMASALLTDQAGHDAGGAPAPAGAAGRRQVPRVIPSLGDGHVGFAAFLRLGGEPGVLLAVEQPVQPSGNHATDQRGHDEQPHLAQRRAPDDQGRAEAAGRVDRRAGDRDTDQVHHGQAQPDGDGRGGRVRRGRRDPQDHEDEERGQDDLEDQGPADPDVDERAGTPAVGAQAGDLPVVQG
jgi:glutamate decarboxylase